MLATDTDFDLSIHYDITGNSITEGKMGDIKAVSYTHLTLPTILLV